MFVQLQGLSSDELRKRKEMLDKEMETEIDELCKRYAAKRQPILDAIFAKKRIQSQTNF
jgi:hypothetical protein